MGSPIAIRQAREADRELLLRFHQDLYQSHRNEIVPDDIIPLIDYRDYGSLLEADVDALLSDRSRRILVAEVDDRPVGYITGRAEVDPQRVLTRRATIEDWFVDDSYRGRGVGKALLTALEAHFFSIGCQVLESGTWSSNQGARAAHDALGFEEVRVVYRKPLTQ